MTCKPILVFLEENGIAPTLLNKKRWQAGWTLSELRDGRESVLENYDKSIENEFGKDFKKLKEIAKKKKNEKRIAEIIEREKKRREKFQQFTKIQTGIKWKQLFIANFFVNE